MGLYGKSACHTNAPKSGPLLPSPPVPRYLPRHSAPLVVCEVTGVKGAACSKRKGVFYVAENVSGLMLVSPSAPVGRVIKVRSLVGLYGKSACHTTPPKWGPMYRRARVQFLETAMTKIVHNGQKRRGIEKKLKNVRNLQEKQCFKLTPSRLSVVLPGATEPRAKPHKKKQTCPPTTSRPTCVSVVAVFLLSFLCDY